MNGISLKNLRSFFVKPILPDVFTQKFQEGELIKGKIIQAMSKSDFFVLNTKGINLVAQSKIALFAGDIIVGKVLKNKSQIELKLVEVNGNKIHQNVTISSEEINYTQLPLPESYFGKKSTLEIYPDKENSRQNGGNPAHDSIYLIINSSLLNHLAIDLKYANEKLAGKIWVEQPKLRDFLSQRVSELEEFLIDENIQSVELKILDMQREIGSFRKQWTGLANLDIRV